MLCTDIVFDIQNNICTQHVFQFSAKIRASDKDLPIFDSLFQLRAKKGNVKKPKFSMRKILKKNDKIWFKDWKPKIAKLCNSNDHFLFEWFLTPRSTIRKLSNSSKICLWLMKHHQARQCEFLL